MRKFSWLLALAIPAVLVSCKKDLTHSEEQLEINSVAVTGNGSPSGAHYNLNIIGVEKGKSADMTGTNGHVIFVKLDGKTKINLTEGSTYSVLDANGTDADGASFQLPNPDPDNDGTTEYSVFARALGKPGGSATVTTCATVTEGDFAGEELCSVDPLSVTRSKGKQSFTNVSQQLLYIYADIDGDGDIDRVPLFDDRMYDYFWQYDNKGLRLLQLRFYEISTTVADPTN